MEEQIKRIVAQYCKIPWEEISPTTRIDKSAIGNSILLHRMYGKLAEEGVHISDYSQIQTFADLIILTSGKAANFIITDNFSNSTFSNKIYSQVPQKHGIGIDLEQVSALPSAVDFREDPFYHSNFTDKEISHCILQKDPYSSFAGLFAAKEAILKANNYYHGKAFNSIEIDHTPEGKPYFANAEISISHTADLAVAVVIFQKTADDIGYLAKQNTSSVSIKKDKLLYLLVIISLFIGALSLLHGLN